MLDETIKLAQGYGLLQIFAFGLLSSEWKCHSVKLDGLPSLENGVTISVEVKVAQGYGLLVWLHVLYLHFSTVLTLSDHITCNYFSSFSFHFWGIQCPFHCSIRNSCNIQDQFTHLRRASLAVVINVYPLERTIPSFKCNESFQTLVLNSKNVSSRRWCLCPPHYFNAVCFFFQIKWIFLNVTLNQKIFYSCVLYTGYFGTFALWTDKKSKFTWFTLLYSSLIRAGLCTRRNFSHGWGFHLPQNSRYPTKFTSSWNSCCFQIKNAEYHFNVIWCHYKPDQMKLEDKGNKHISSNFKKNLNRTLPANV